MRRRIVITAGGQEVHALKLDRATYLAWTGKDLQEAMRENIPEYDRIAQFWRFRGEDASPVSDLAVETPEGDLEVAMHYEKQPARKRQPVVVDPGRPVMRKQPGLKLGEKPYPLLWDPPLVERRDTGTARGRGLFALHPIRTGTFITEYGGEILSHERATDLPACDKTHLLPMYQDGPVFDGREHGAYTYAWYESQGLLAQFANDKRDTGKRGNVDYKSQRSAYPGGEHLTPSGERVPVAVRKFLVATRNIAVGEELLLLNYGPGHQKFEEECREAQLRE